MIRHPGHASAPKACKHPWPRLFFILQKAGVIPMVSPAFFYVFGVLGLLFLFRIKEVCAIVFYPGEVQEEMYRNCGNKGYGEIKMDASPFVSAQ